LNTFYPVMPRRRVRGCRPHKLLPLWAGSDSVEEVQAHSVFGQPMGSPGPACRGLGQLITDGRKIAGIEVIDRIKPWNSVYEAS